MPGWRNGLRRGLKILDPKGFVGSNPTPGTESMNNSDQFNKVTQELEELARTYSAKKGSPGYEEIWVPGDQVKLWSVPRQTGQLLRLFTLAKKPPIILELGTSAGYSAIWLASAAKEYGGKVYTVELAKPKIRMAEKYFKAAGLDGYIEQIEGKIEEVLNKWDKTINFVFLDADKMKYATYIQQFEKHLGEGAIIIADNAISHADLMKDYLDYVGKSDSYISHLITIDNGLMVSIKR